MDWHCGRILRSGANRGSHLDFAGTVGATRPVSNVSGVSKPCELPVEAPLELYVQAGRPRDPRLEEEELERDHDMKFHDGRTLDMRHPAREALIVEFTDRSHVAGRIVPVSVHAAAPISMTARAGAGPRPVEKRPDLRS